jgi:hypothetical protein
VQQIVPQAADTLAHPLARPVVDVILELVDLGVDRDDDVQERGGYVVEETEEELAGRHASRGRVLQRFRRPRLTALGRLTDRYQELGGCDDVDLSVHDAILLRDRDGIEEDPQHVRPVTLEKRPGVLVSGWGRERLHYVGIDADRKRTAQLLVGRIEEVDPARAHRWRA